MNKNNIVKSQKSLFYIRNRNLRYLLIEIKFNFNNEINMIDYNNIFITNIKLIKFYVIFIFNIFIYKILYIKEIMRREDIFKKEY